MNQNHDTPSTALRTAGVRRVSFHTAQFSGSGFQFTFSVGSPASTRGIMRATALPKIASATIEAAAVSGPQVPAIWNTRPPKIIPHRIEIEVPISTRPLPPVSSSGLSTEGRIEYFTGPNSADCSPVPNSAASSTTMFEVRKPIAATDMMPISIAVVTTISFCFSIRSAICPAMPENRKYGRMNSAGAMLV